MSNMDNILRAMTFEFFGSGKYKIDMDELFTMENTIFLDVRSIPEVESVHLKLGHHIDVLHISVSEIPDRINEIPRDKTIGIFCSTGARSAIVYAYLRFKGYENVRIALGGYEAITNLLLPGKMLKHIEMKQRS